MASEPVGDWDGTVELAETVTVPPLSVRIARCRVVGRDDSAEVIKVPRYQEVLVDPEGMPGVYLARVVATLENVKSSANVGGSDPFMITVNKSPLVDSVFSPHNKLIANCDESKSVAGSNSSFSFIERDGGFLKVGTGECLPKLPEYGRSVAAIRHKDDLQARGGSLPVENETGNQVDTKYKNTAQRSKKEKGHEKNEITKPQKQGDSMQNSYHSRKKIQVLGYVPIQIANLSLEEIEINKNSYIGVASPIQNNEVSDCEENMVNSVERTHRNAKNEFRDCLREKLEHLDGKDRHILEPVLRQYRHLFYGLGSTELGCTSQVEHSIDTGDARPIKRNPYRTPYALKPVVDEHVNDMLKRNIIEPSMSPWSSSIVLVQTKSKDGSVKYRFCIDYRALNVVTPDFTYLCKQGEINMAAK